jgi:hypothetical protein
MPATGELIRSMNYVEDITTTLRRICISIPAMPPDERQRLAESLRAAGVAIAAAVSDLEIMRCAVRKMKSAPISTKGLH